MPHQSPAQKLDIYLPDKGDGPFPVIVSIHGGAWMFGDKGDIMNLHFLEGLKRNFAVVCMNYRLSDEAQFPKQIYDCKAAVRFLRANAEKYHLGCESNRGLGRLCRRASGCAARDKPKGAQARGFHHGKPSILKRGPCGRGLVWPDGKLPENGRAADRQRHGRAGSLLSRIRPSPSCLGQPITEVPDLVRFASPMTYIKANMPPFLIQHGLKDEIVPVQQSMNFAAEIERGAGPKRVTLEILQRCHPR